MSNLLTEAGFKGTINQPERITEGEPVVDFWDYVEQIPEEDYQGFDCSAGEVRNVYRMAGGGYEHVLIESTTQGVAMTIVLDLRSKRVYGHYLLNLANAEPAPSDEADKAG